MSATTRNLQDYQRRLQALLDNMAQSATLASGAPPAEQSALPPSGAWPSTSDTLSASATAGASPSTGLFGGLLQGSTTPSATASRLRQRSLILPKGTAFTCALTTRVVSAAAGLVGCEVQRNLYGDDGRVLLIERGSHLDGEYRVTSFKPGTVRIPVLWTRVRTPLGVVADLDSPGTGQLGESGIDGYVDKRWGERIGAAMLLSLIDDSVKLIVQSEAATNANGQSSTVVLPTTTDSTSKLAEKVLESTINIPPLIYQNQGGVVGVYVARDLDFSAVYELQPTPLAPASEHPAKASP